MHRYARLIGAAVVAVGLAVLISFGYYASASMGDFRKAQMFHERNPGNAMYDAQFFVAASQLLFLVGGAAGGLLLALNGATWIALGSAVRALQRDGSTR
jgi:hypothetical protein